MINSLLLFLEFFVVSFVLLLLDDDLLPDPFVVEVCPLPGLVVILEHIRLGLLLFLHDLSHN